MSRTRNIPKCSGPRKATGDGFRLLAPGWLLAPDPFSFLSQASNPQGVEWPTWIWALFLGTLPYRRHWGQIKYVEPLWTLVSKFASERALYRRHCHFRQQNAGIISAALVVPAAKPGPSRLSEVLMPTLHGPSNPACLLLHLLSKVLSLLYPSGQHLTVRLLTLPCPLSHPGPLHLSSGLLRSTADPCDKRDLFHPSAEKRSQMLPMKQSLKAVPARPLGPQPSAHADSLPATSRRLAHIARALLTSPGALLTSRLQEDWPPLRLGHRRPLSGGKLL